MHICPPKNERRPMRPVFIGGCARSGTTMLGSILGAHRACVCVPESQFATDLLREYVRTGQDLELPEMVDRLREHFRFRLWQLPIDWDAEVCSDCVSSYPDLMEFLVRRYAGEHGRESAAIWVDHTPSNTRYATTLLDVFPDAKFIHLVRDGRAVSASICPLDWGPNVVAVAAPWWAEHVGYGLAAEASLGRARVLRLRYEDILLRPYETIRGAADFLGLDFDPGMVEAGGFTRPVFTRNEHALVGRPPDRSRVDAWKASLTDREVEIFEHVTADLLFHLGYEPRFGAAAMPPTPRERFGVAINDIVGRCINRVRRNRRKWQARRRIATHGASQRHASAALSDIR